MRKKAALILAFLLLVTACISGCGKSSPPAGNEASGNEGASETQQNTTKYTIRIATSIARPDASAEFLYQFKDAIEAKTDRITVECYPANQFGNNNEMVTAVQGGTLQAVVLPPGFLASICPAVNLIDCPLIFGLGDNSLAFRVLNDGVDFIDKAFDDVGLDVPAWLWSSELWCICTKPNATIENLKGLKIRVVNSEVSMLTAEALGVTPIVMSSGDIPMALQQGTLDGGFNGLTLITALGLHEIAGYLSPIPLTPCPMVVAFNKAFMASLPEDLSILVTDIVRDLALGANYDLMTSDYEGFLDVIESAGVTITRPSPATNAALEAALVPVYEQFPDLFPDLAEGYREIVDKVSAYKS